MNENAGRWECEDDWKEGVIGVSLNRKAFYTNFPFKLGLRSSSENDSEEDFR